MNWRPIVDQIIDQILDFFFRTRTTYELSEDAFEQELRLAHAKDIDDWDEAFHTATGKWPPWYRQDYRAPGQVSNYPGQVIGCTFNQLLRSGLAQALNQATGIYDQQLGQHQCATHEEFVARQMAMQGIAKRQQTPFEQLQHQLGLQQQIGPGFDASYLQSLLGNAAKSPKSRPE